MKLKKKKIVKELEVILNKNQKKIQDIWLFGNFDDEVSDIDIIVVYKNLTKLNFSNLIKNLLKGGTIIYIPNRIKNRIFLFEDLKIFSIKYKKKIKDSVPKKFIKFRALTSFLERYYYARLLYKNVKRKVVDRNFIDLKSIIFSYENFKKILLHYRIKSNSSHYSIEKYKSMRKKFLYNRNDKSIYNFFLEMKEKDNKFFLRSIKILDNLFNSSNNQSFRFKFFKSQFYHQQGIKKNVPNIYGQIYSFYGNQNTQISKKIISDFNPKNKIYKFNKSFQNYLSLKLDFLNKNYSDLKKKGFKSGLYRFKWYL